MFSRITLSVLCFMASSAMAMSALPDASYSGSGQWKDQAGGTGNYQVTVTSKANVLTSVYNFNGQGKTFTMSAPLDQNGFFPVSVNGQNVGSGYCFSIQCHYSVGIGTMSLEESLTFYQDHLYRTGSKTEGGQTVVWEEAMDLTK